MSPLTPSPTTPAARARQRYSRALLLWLAFVVAIACASPSQEWPSLQQPESPPPEVLNSPLTNNRWRLEVAMLDGEAVIFDYFRPVYVFFSKNGGVSIQSERCGAAGYAIAYLYGQRYHIGEGWATADACSVYTGIDCAEVVGNELNHIACEQWQVIDRQRSDLTRTLEATTEYEYDVNWDELVLRGENAAMLLKPDNNYSQ